MSRGGWWVERQDCQGNWGPMSRVVGSYGQKVYALGWYHALSSEIPRPAYRLVCDGETMEETDAVDAPSPQASAGPPALLVSYDITRISGERNDAVQAFLRESEGWWHYVVGTWIVRDARYGSAADLSRLLIPMVHTHTAFVVMKLPEAFAFQGKLPESAWTWLHENFEHTGERVQGDAHGLTGGGNDGE